MKNGKLVVEVLQLKESSSLKPGFISADGKYYKVLSTIAVSRIHAVWSIARDEHRVLWLRREGGSSLSFRSKKSAAQLQYYLYYVHVTCVVLFVEKRGHSHSQVDSSNRFMEFLYVCWMMDRNGSHEQGLHSSLQPDHRFVAIKQECMTVEWIIH